MPGESSGTGAADRGGATTCDLAGMGAGAAGDVPTRLPDVDEAATATGVDATTAGAPNNLAPHIPQKRFSSEFSLPQRGQRNDPLLSPYIAYDILKIRCRTQARGSCKMTSNGRQGRGKNLFLVASFVSSLRRRVGTNSLEWCLNRCRIE